MEPKWLWNRLKAMSVREVAHRSNRVLRYIADSGLYHAGLFADRRVSVHPAKTCLFGRDFEVGLNSKRPSKSESADCRSAWLANRFQFFDPDTRFDLESPVQWHKDPKTGTLSPQQFGRSIDYRNDELVGEIKYLWELGRHQFLVPMAIFVAENKDDAIRQKLESHLSSWIEQNPIGMGIHWCSALEVSLRLISWCLVHAILQAGGYKNGIFDVSGNRDDLERHIYAQVKFVVCNYSRYSSANNHLIGELTGVWTACNVFDLGRKGQQWRGAAMVELEREIQLQTHSDGVNKEQAIYYHLWSLEYFWLNWAIAKRYERSISVVYEKHIISMFLFLESMCASTDYPSQIGDSDGGVVSRFNPDISDNVFRSFLDAVSMAFEGAEQRVLEYQDVYSKCFWYGKIIDGSDISSILHHYRKRKQGVSEHYVFEHGGYFVFKGTNCQLLFKAGPFGYLSTAAHGHADALSITLAINADWWLVDSGTYSYHSAGEWRNYFRSTQAHNTLCVNNENQSEIAGDFLWRRKTDAKAHQVNWNDGVSTPYLAEVIASHTGYTHEGVVHKRRVECDGLHTCEVHDEIITDETFEACDIALAYHFHPAVELQQLDTHRWLATRQNSELSLMLDLPSQLEWLVKKGERTPKMGWYSDTYGVKVPANALVGRKFLQHQELQNPITDLYRTRLVIQNATRKSVADGMQQP